MDFLAQASAAEHAAQCFVDKINQAILFPLIALLLALAFLIFLYGCFEYVRDSESDQGREKGKQHILYGTIGMLVMLSAYSILSLAAGTFGIGLFNDNSIDCGAPPVVQTTTPTIGGILSGAGIDISDSPFGGAIIPGEDPLPNLPPPPLPLISPDSISVDTLPEVDGSTPCPPRQSRVDGVCTTMYPFEIRNNAQIEVSCIGDSTCVGAIAACENHYGGVMNTVNNSGGYVVCNDSNFSTGPASTVTYANAPAGMFTAPPELNGYTPGVDAPPVVNSFGDSVLFAGSNTFVTPEFGENYTAYVAPYVIENNVDEQAILDEYGQYGVTTVLFMVPQVETQQGATMSQVEGRCEDLGGELTLESGTNKVTTVSTYACLR